MSPALRASCRPVSVPLAARVNASFGKGRRQADLSNGSHFVAACAAAGTTAAAKSKTVRAVRFTGSKLHRLVSLVHGTGRNADTPAAAADGGRPGRSPAL